MKDFQLGVSEEEMRQLAEKSLGNQGNETPQEVPQGTQEENRTVDFSAQMAKQQQNQQTSPQNKGPLTSDDTLMPTSEQTEPDEIAEGLNSTRMKVQTSQQNTPNNTQNVTQGLFQGNEGEVPQFKGGGVEVVEDPNENDNADPVNNAEQYMDSLKEEIVDPNVREIIKNMEKITPQLSRSLGGTPELDEKYAEELKEKEKLSPIYQGTRVGTVTTFTEDGKQIQEEQLVSHSTVFDEDEDESNLTETGKKFKETVVHIDKFNKTNVHFSPEEKAKLTHSTKIVLEEIEEIDLRQVKRRKMSDNVAVSTISPLRANTHNETNVPLLSSGVVASFDGCPPLEVMGLNVEENMPVFQRTQIYADFLYNHLKSTSIGKNITREDFDKFAHNDIEMMFYAIVCSTYPEMDYVPVVCDSKSCGGKKEYQHYYSTRSLFRVERLHEDALEIMSKLHEATTTLESQRLYKNSAALQTKTFRLPDSRSIVVLSSTSIGEFVKRTVDMQDLPPEYLFSGTASIYVQQILVPPAGTEELTATHTSIEDTIPIIEFVQGLSSKDYAVIQEMISRLQENITPQFGLFDLTCPHCGDQKEFQPLNPSELLFFRVELEMTRPVELKHSQSSTSK